ncbi:MAG: cellulase family glycosylhydrolase [Candidatus Altiarchaeota archaeon]|nr:cellulase family glycosylhydrolase [Candidatus Altiarchaeota archaeon]
MEGKIFYTLLTVTLILVNGCMEPGETTTTNPGTSTTTTFYITDNETEAKHYAVRLWFGGYAPSDDYLDSIAERYDYGMISPNPELINALLSRNPDMKLLLYTDPVFTQPSINYPEDYYAHSSQSTNYNNRVINERYGTYLMDISSRGWRNEVAESAKEDVNNYGYYGVMADDCGPDITGRVDFLPDNYDALVWRTEVRDMLSVINDRLDCLLVFNGIYNDPDYSGRDLLEVTDGGAREGFVFHLGSGEFLPEKHWRILLNWIIEDTEKECHIACAKLRKKTGEEFSVDERMFAFTSYLLVRNEHVVYMVEDWGLVTGIDETLVQYYPEMDIDLGAPLETCTQVEACLNKESGLYERKFEKGRVFVNPSNKPVEYILGKKYFVVVPKGGGVLEDDGTYGGTLGSQEVSKITVPSQSGVVVLKTSTIKPVCVNSLDCPSQMKCENSVCIDVGCIEEGGTGPSAGINPEWLDHLPTECCESLKSITNPGLYNKNCDFRPIPGAPSKVCANCGNEQCGKGETGCNCPGDCNFKIKPALVIWSGTSLSEAQLQFAANNYCSIQIGKDFIDEPIYADLRRYNSDVLLLGYINSRHVKPGNYRHLECEEDEALFAHDDGGRRIRNLDFDNYLMDIHNPDWTAKIMEWVNEHPPDANGIMLDSAHPTLYESGYSSLPAGYDPCQYALSMEKLFANVSANTNLLITFNGLSKGIMCGEDVCQECGNYVGDVDGGGVEGFVFRKVPQDVDVGCLYNNVNAIIKTGKLGKMSNAYTRYDMNDIPKRTFAFAAYMLGMNEYSSYAFTDMKHEFSDPLQYYPEYGIDLGAPLDFPSDVKELLQGNLAVRNFEKGKVIVNPFNTAGEIQAPQGYKKIIPHGGGLVDINGKYDGYLEYQEVPAGTLTVSAKTAVILVKESREPTVCGNGICEEGETNANCPGDCKTGNISWLSVSGEKIVDEKGDEMKLRGVHYDAFYVIPKQIYFASKQNKEKIDGYNTELSKYFFNEYDIKEIGDINANVIRLELRLWEIEKEPYVYSQESLRHLDDTIAKFRENGIYVILDLHAAGQNRLTHNNEYGDILWEDDELQNRVAALWGVLAERYKNNPYVAGYDLINEPQAPTKETLHNFYQKVIDEIREKDKKHILFIEWNLYKTEDILFGGEYDDPNIVLSVHFYRPSEFTNQGLHDLPVGQKYPGTYHGVYWDKDRIDNYFTEILDNEIVKGKPLFVGEFSTNIVDGGEDALQWTEDTFDVLNSKDIHYTFFLYKFAFTPSFAYYQPGEQLGNQIKVLINQLVSGQLCFEDLSDEQKELFLTEKYQSPQGLRQILEEGFKK